MPGASFLQAGQGALPACHRALNLCLLLWRVLLDGGATGATHPCLPPPSCRSSTCACCPAGGVPLAEKPGGAAWVTPSSNPKAGTPLQDAFKQSEVGAVSFEGLAVRVRWAAGYQNVHDREVMQRPMPLNLASRVKMSTAVPESPEYVRQNTCCGRTPLLFGHLQGQSNPFTFLPLRPCRQLVV